MKPSDRGAAGSTSKPLHLRFFPASRTGGRDFPATVGDRRSPNCWSRLSREHGRSGALTRVERCVRIGLREEEAGLSRRATETDLPVFAGARRPAAHRSLRSYSHGLLALEAQTDAIRYGADDAVCPAPLGANEYSRAKSSSARICADWMRRRAGPGYYFYRHGQRREDNCASVPRTLRAQSTRCRSFACESTAPRCSYSVFTPGTGAAAASGVTNTCGSS